MLLRLNSSTSLYMNVHVVLWWNSWSCLKSEMLWRFVLVVFAGTSRPAQRATPHWRTPRLTTWTCSAWSSACVDWCSRWPTTHTNAHFYPLTPPAASSFASVCVCVCVVCVSTTKGELPLNGGPWSGPGVPFRRLKVNSPFRWKDGGQLLTFSTEDTIKTTKRAVPDQAHVASLSNRGELV